MAYKKTIETKIVRTTHEVSFREGTTVFSIIDDLKHVPSTAKLTDYDMDNNSCVFTFSEEKPEPSA